MAGALQGIRVVEAAEGVPGPYCGKLLAGLGADVIKVEPPRGDRSRYEGPFPGDIEDRERSGLFLHLNTGKRSLLADLATNDGRARLDALVATADVLVLGHRQPELEALGLRIDEVRARHPRLVVTDVTSFGLTGPYAEYLGGELIAYALSGYMMLTGLPDREPIKAYGNLVEYQAGTHAALGTIAALFARESTGAGQLVDVSAMEAGTFLLGGVEQTAYFTGTVIRRNGTRLLGTIPQHPYPSTIRPCADGYVHAHSNNRHRDLLGHMVGHPRLLDPALLAEMTGHADEIDAILDEWLREKTRREVVELAQSMRLPFTEVFEPGEVMMDPKHLERESFVDVDHPGAGRLRQPGAPIRMPVTPWNTGPAPALGQHNFDAAWRDPPLVPAPSLAGPKRRPLEGLRVLDFTVAVAGPIATAVLGDLGADVIKIEAPNGRPITGAGAAPLLPGYPDRPYDRLSVFNELNHAKRGISLDVATPEGREIFLRLVAVSDVVVQNFAPRVMGNLGLGYETLREANPDVILVSMPAFGLDGPYRDRSSYGPGVDAMSGLSHLTGYADGPPMKPGNFFCDQQAGILAAFATLVALWHRAHGGHGQHVVLPMIDGEFQVLGDAYLDYAMNGRERRRCGNDHPWMAPHDVFPCRGEDAWVAIAVEDDRQWRALCRVIGQPGLADDPRFATREARHAHRADLRPAIAAWTVARTHYEAMHALQAAGVPAGAVLNAVELLSDPHVAARHGFEYVDVPGVGPTPYPRVAFILDETPVPIEKPAPGFAQHNDEVYRELLGLAEEQLAALESRGIIARVPLGEGAQAGGH
ncbi:MAG: CoA transferase [Dehalococcoidia bacterium]